MALLSSVPSYVDNSSLVNRRCDPVFMRTVPSPLSSSLPPNQWSGHVEKRSANFCRCGLKAGSSRTAARNAANTESLHKTPVSPIFLDQETHSLVDNGSHACKKCTAWKILYKSHMLVKANTGHLITTVKRTKSTNGFIFRTKWSDNVDFNTCAR